MDLSYSRRFQSVYIQACATEWDDTDPDRPFDPTDIDMVFICATLPESAEYWGVYGIMRSDGTSQHITDFDRETDALNYARIVAKGIPVDRVTENGTEHNI
jgi:hypothetical protein